MPAIVHVLIPGLILRAASTQAPPRLGPLELGSILLAVVGLSMMLWVAVVFVRRGRGTAMPLLPPQKFVAEGLYRVVRNPMYLGILLVIVAEAIFFRSAWLLLYAAALWLAAHGFLVLVEEPQLVKRFGTTYQEYTRSTPRWIPRLPRRRGA